MCDVGSFLEKAREIGAAVGAAIHHDLTRWDDAMDKRVAAPITHESVTEGIARLAQGWLGRPIEEQQAELQGVYVGLDLAEPEPVPRSVPGFAASAGSAREFMERQGIHAPDFAAVQLTEAEAGTLAAFTRQLDDEKAEIERRKTLPARKATSKERRSMRHVMVKSLRESGMSTKVAKTYAFEVVRVMTK